MNNFDPNANSPATKDALTKEEIILTAIIVLIALGLLYWIFTSAKPSVPLIHGTVAGAAAISALGANEVAAMLHG